MQLCVENLGLSMEELCDFQSLFNRFYTLNSGTSVTGQELDARTLLSKDLSIQGDNSEPQILIYHTHSQEAYRDSETGAVQDTVVGVGEELARILTEQYGYNVLHDTGIYDMTDGVLDRDSAYQNAYPAIETILAQYPSIEAVIDLHRDGVMEDVHLVTEIDGVPTAKIMFFNGVCRDENGPLEDLVNPYLEDNLAFSLQMRLASMLISQDFCRTNYLKTWRYNQQLLGRCLLVEVGAQTNTVQEARNACAPLAQALDYVLGGNQ
jgi:stage II sporulation protein P